MAQQKVQQLENETNAKTSKKKKISEKEKQTKFAVFSVFIE